MRIINPENIGRVASLALILNLGFFGMKATAAETPKGTVSECLPVLPKYQERVTASNTLIEPAPGGNEQYYLIIQKPQFMIELLQKNLKKNTIESEISINTKTIATEGRVEVDFKDAAPNIFVEFDFANSVTKNTLTTHYASEICRTLN